MSRPIIRAGEAIAALVVLAVAFVLAATSSGGAREPLRLDRALRRRRLDPGRYEARLMLDDGYVALARAPFAPR